MLPNGAEWATEGYSYVIPHGIAWAAFVKIEDGFKMIATGKRTDMVTQAKKAGNRLKRMEDKQSAYVPSD